MCGPKASPSKFNFESTSRKLLSHSLGDGLRCATDLRERIEIVHTSEYVHFLRFLFPAFRELLLNRLNSDSAIESIENRFRHVILEILNRLPNNELLRPYTPELLRIATETLSRDNEENALTCLRIIFDLHKNFRPALEGEVQSFLDLVRRIYRMLPTSTKKAFTECTPDGLDNMIQATNVISAPVGASVRSLQRHPFASIQKLGKSKGAHPTSQHAVAVNVSTGSSRSVPTRTAVTPLKGLDSFKVLTECPLIVMLLFQLYPRYIQDNIPQLTPLMMGGLALRAPSVAYKQQRERYREFIACQVKTLSFLTYLLRGFSDLMKPYQDAISKSVIALMIACPGDAVATRKELLVATRHILATDFRRGFFGHVNILLNEKVLVGVGRPSQDTLRPLAFSTLADLIHHVRSKLDIDQLARVVVLFSRNLQDSALPLAVQTTSVRLLLNLVDYIFHNVDSNVARGKSLLVCILRAIVAKLETLRWLIVEFAQSRARPSDASTHERRSSEHAFLSSPCNTNNFKRTFSKDNSGAWSGTELTRSMLPPVHSSVTNGHPYNFTEYAADIRALLHTMLRGLKTVLWCVSRYQKINSRCDNAMDITSVHPPSSNGKNKDLITRTSQLGKVETYVLTQEEADIVSDFFKWGLSCCQLYIHGAKLSALDEKEILDNLAGAFTVLDGYNLRLIIGRHIPLLFMATLKTPVVLGVSQLLLANTNASATFAELMLSYLSTRLDDLAYLNHPNLCSKVPCGQSISSGRCGSGACLACASGTSMASMVAGCASYFSATSHAIWPSFRASMLLRFLKIVFGSVTLFEGNEVALYGRLQLLLFEALRRAASAHRPTGYLLLLRALFRSFGNSYSSENRNILNESNSQMETVLPVVVKALLLLRWQLSRSKLVHLLITELCLTLPMHLSTMNTMIHYLIEPLAYALKFPGFDLTSLSLRTFEYYLDHLGIECVSAALDAQPAVTAVFIGALYSHLRPTPYPYGTLAIRVLGKLGGRNRHFLGMCHTHEHTQESPLELNEPWDLVPPSTTSQALLWNSKRPLIMLAQEEHVCSPLHKENTWTLVLNFKWRHDQLALLNRCDIHRDFPQRSLTRAVLSVHGSDDSFALPLGDCVRASCELLHALLQVSEMKAVPKSSTKNLFKYRYSALCFTFVATALNCLVSKPCLSTSCIKPSSGAVMAHAACDRSTGSALDHANAQFQSLLGAVLCAAADSRLSLKATRLLESLCLHFAALFNCQSWPNNDLDTSGSRVVWPKSVPFMQPSDSLSLYSMNRMLVRALFDSNLKVQKSAMRMMRHLVSCMMDLETRRSEKTGELKGFALISDLILRVCILFNHPSLYARQAACRALHCLVPILGVAWVRYLGSLVIKFLFRALNDQELETSIQPVNDLICTLCSIIRTSCGRSDPNLPPIFTVLLPELGSKHPAKRLAAQSALIEFNLAAGFVDLASTPVPRDIVCTVALTALKIIKNAHSIKMMIGALDALTFLLCTSPPAIPFDYTLQCVLADALLHFQKRRSAGHTKCLDAAHIDVVRGTHQVCQRNSAAFCAALSLTSIQHSFLSVSDQEHIFHAALLRAIYAGTRASLLTCANHKNARDMISIKGQLLYLRFALESISHSESIVISSAEILLGSILTLGLRHKALSSHIFLVLDHFAHFDCQSLTLLGGLERLLIIPASRVRMIEHLSWRICSHLSSWAERIQSATTFDWQMSRFLQVASKLVLLLAHVPCITLTSVFFENESNESSNAQHQRNVAKVLSHSNLPRPLDSNTDCISTVGKIVQIIIELEAVLPKYSGVLSNFKNEPSGPGVASDGESPITFPLTPFRKPLACFLSRNSNFALAYFLRRENLMLQRHVSLLREILTLPEAAALRCRFTGKQGIELLSEAAFYSAVVLCRSRAAYFAASHQTACLARNTVESVRDWDMPDAHSQVKCKVLRGALSSCVGAPRFSNCRDVEPQANLRFHGLQILQTLQEVDPRLIGPQNLLLGCLRAIWRSRACLRPTHNLPQVSTKDELSMQNDSEARVMVQCFLSYLRVHPHDIQVLFDVLPVLIYPSPVDFTFLKKFLCDEVASTWAYESKKHILFFFLRMLSDVALSSEIKILALRFIVTPTLIYSCNNHESRSASVEMQHGDLSAVCDSDLVALFMTSALDVSDDAISCHSEALRVELLKLTTVLIEHLGLQLVEHRKELIKFAWNHLKSDDSLSKQWAYVNVCRFIATYETPPKIILQVYVALLRTFQPEARELVKVALDVLVPSLPGRLPLADFIKAIKWTKKIMYEEGHALPQLIHMWQLIIRHPSLFYPYRTQFVPQMVNSLNRLGLPPNCPIENRQLAVSLADLVISWELQHVKSKEANEGMNEFQPRRTSGNVSGDPTSHYVDDFRLTTAMIELLINFLVRLALFSSDNKEPLVHQLSMQCVALFKVSLAAWPRVHIRFSYLEKLITSSYSRADRSNALPSSAKPYGLTSESVPYSASLLSTCLDIFLAVLDAGPHPNVFFIDNIIKAQQLIFPCFDILQEDIQLKLRNLLVLISRLYPAQQAPVSSLLSSFYMNLKLTIERCLKSTLTRWNLLVGRRGARTSKNAVHNTDEMQLNHNGCIAICQILALLEAVCGQMPYFLANHGSSIVQLAQHLAIHHIQCEPNKHILGVMATPVIALLAPDNVEIHQMAMLDQIGEDGEEPSCVVVQALSTCIKLMENALISRVASEQRRPFVALLFACLERSSSIKLLSMIIELMGRWLSATYSPFTQREKMAFSEMMSSMDRLDDADAQPLLSQFLAIMQRLDTSYSARRVTNLKSRSFNRSSRDALKLPFAVGLFAPDASARAKFRTRFMRWSVDCVGTKLLGLLNCDWTPLSNRFWVVIVAEVLLDCINYESLLISTMTARLPVLDYNAVPATRHDYNLGLIISSLRELVHAHLGLAQNMFHTLVSASTSLAIARHGLELFRLAVSKQLTGTRHPKTYQVPSTLPGGSNAPAIMPRAMASWDRNEFIYEPSEFLLHIHQVPAHSHAPVAPIKNIPQMFLYLANHLATINTFTPDILFVLASKYNCRHDVMIMIEDAYISRKSRGNFDPDNTAVSSLRLLLSLLEQLAETDLSLVTLPTLEQNRMPESASRLQSYGYLPEAQEAYFDAIKDNMRLLHRDVRGSNHHAFGLEFCENGWIGCARDLAQWRVLNTIPVPQQQESVWPSLAQRRSLALESAWKTQSWDFVRQHAGSQTSVDDSVIFAPQDKLLEVRLAIADRRFAEVEDLCTEYIESLLKAWCALPPPQITSHSPLLQLFHELIEVHESGQLLHEAVQHSKNRTFPDLRVMVKTWRNRLPNLWENMSFWDNIMRWREFCFAFIRGEFKAWCLPERVLLLHDSPWTTSATMRVARKHQLAPTITLPQLNELDGFAERMDVDDAFNRLREKILVCHASMSSGLAYAKHGLHLILNTSMNFFSLEQRAELHRLKGTFYCKLGQLNDAHLSFSAATVTCCTYGRAWLAWAALCESQHERLLDQGDELTRSSPLLKYSITCYLAAVEQGCPHAMVGGVARVLRLLRVHHGEEDLTSLISHKIHVLPPWIWVPWIQHLISGLLENETMIDCACLIQIANTYPQALYYPLRAESLHLETHADIVATSHKFIESHLRCIHASLSFEMDVFCDELIVCFKPQQIEMHLSMVELCLESCYDSMERLTDPPPAALCEKLHAACFISCARARELCANYYTLFLRDFSVSSVRTVSLRTITCRLIRWRAALRQKRHEGPRSHPHPHRIAQRRTGLLEIKFCVEISRMLEIPGQYVCTFAKPKPEFNVLLSKLSPYLNSNRAHGSLERHIKFTTEIGTRYSFQAGTSQRSSARVCENCAQFFAVVDYTLSHSLEAQRRRLRIAPLLLFPAGPNLNLRAESASFLALEDIDRFRSTCLDIDVDAQPLCTRQHWVATARQECFSPVDISSLLPFKGRLRSHWEVCDALGGDGDAMFRYVRACANTAELLWKFRLSFARNIGTRSLVGHLLGLGGIETGPAKFCPRSGCIGCIYVKNFNLPPKHTALGMVPGVSPFRLSRNLVAVIRPIMLDGAFALAFGLTTQALDLSTIQEGGIAQPYLFLFSQRKLLGPNRNTNDAKELASKLLSHIRRLAPTLHDGKSREVEHNLRSLIDSTKSPFLHSTMMPTWRPWL